MGYKAARPWILSAAAISFVVIAFWMAKPAGEQPQPDQCALAPDQPAEGHLNNTPGSIGPLKPVEPENSGTPNTEPVDSMALEPVPVDEPLQPQPPEPEPEAPKLTTEELCALLAEMIKEKDAAGVRKHFPELQARGPDGLIAAARLVNDLIRAFSAEEVDLPRQNPPEGWATLAEWLAMFTPALVTHVAEQGQDLAGMAEFFMHLHLMEDWSLSERVKVAGNFLIAERVDGSYLPRYTAMYALQLMPCDESAGYATRFLEIPAAETSEDVRYGAAWVIARRGLEVDWALLEQIKDNDPSERVRGTATYHLLARGVTEEGILIIEIADNGTAAAVGLKPGDIIKKVNGKDVRYMEDMADDYSTPSEFVVNRYGATVTFKLDAGRHGIDGRHVPPEFLK